MYIPFYCSESVVSFRCCYPDGHAVNHYQKLTPQEIIKWIDCYRFTHPGCISISVKVWFEDEEVAPDA